MNITDNVNKALKGDQDAIGELYYFTYPKMHAVAVSILKNEADADDVVQDSYIKAFSSLDSLNDAQCFESWLGKIVSNKCRDYLKKKKPILFSTQNDDDNVEPFELSIEDESVEYNPEAVLVSSDTKKQIMDLLNTLPDEQRICFIYHIVQEMKISEIAEMLGVSENTVKSRLNYAKSKMRTKINELEKNGVKLRGFAGFALFPFIRQLFASQTTSVPPVSAEILVSTAASSNTAVAASQTVSTVVGAASKTVAGKTIQHLGVKIAAGVVAAALTVGTVATVTNISGSKDDDFSNTQIIYDDYSQKIDPFDYLDVYFVGYDKIGTTSLKFYKDELATDVIDSYYKDKKIVLQKHKVKNGITYKCSKKDSLTNGEKISIEFIIDEALSDIVSAKSKSFTVSNLEPTDSIDVFSKLKVDFSGVSGRGSADISFDSEDEILNSYYFYFDDQYGLANNDIITITIDRVEEVAEKYKVVPIETKKKYKVCDLPHYLSDSNEIPMDVISELKNSYIAEEENNLKTSEKEYKNFQYIGTYFLYDHRVESTVNSIYIYIYYEYYDKTAIGTYLRKVYMPMKFNNVTISANGEMNIKYEDGKTPSFSTDFERTLERLNEEWEKVIKID